MTEPRKSANQDSIDQMKADLVLGDAQLETARQAIRDTDAGVTDLGDLGAMKTNAEVVADHKAARDE